MRQLIKRLGRDQKRVCRAYAEGERRGEVSRVNNSTRLTPDEYAHALWIDGERKGWF
jgi:hypothetical protein